MVTVNFGGRQLYVINDIKEFLSYISDFCDVFDNFQNIDDVINFVNGKYQQDYYGSTAFHVKPFPVDGFINKKPVGQYVNCHWCFTLNLYDNFTQQETIDITNQFDNSGYPYADIMLVKDTSGKIWFIQTESD